MDSTELIALCNEFCRERLAGRDIVYGSEVEALIKEFLGIKDDYIWQKEEIVGCDTIFQFGGKE